MSRTVIDGGAVIAMDGTEHPEGHVVVDGERIAAVGAGPAPGGPRFDASGCVVTPGLVDAHQHLFQWATRGFAADSSLFDWLTALYPVWSGLDEETAHAAAAAGLGRLALSGCTAVADHHYVFPRGGGDVLGAVVAASSRIGTRLHAVRGCMDRGRSRGGLPPDPVVEDADEALAAADQAVRRFHEPAPGAAVRIALGPCSPFTTSPDLMRGCAELARHRGVRLHTHLAETVDEDRQCRAEFGRSPVEHAEDLGWLGPDVWLAHAVHPSAAEVERLGRTGTAVAHCPSSNGRLGSGVAPVRALLDAGAPVGLGVDGVASNEAGDLVAEVRQALLTARAAGGPRALATREALWLATRGSARCLGRDDELGSLEPGKLADVAVWRLDGLDHAGIDDPVAALVLGSPPRLELLMCGGVPIVEAGRLTRADDLAGELRAASRRIRAHAPEVAR